MTKIDNWRNADGRTAAPFSEDTEEGLSPWFDGIAHKPSYPGVYMQMSGSYVGYQMWDGIKWGPWCRTFNGAQRTRPGDYASDRFQHDNWRGTLAPNPAAQKNLLDEHDRLVGEAAVMRELLREAHGVIKSVQAESTEEADLLAELLRGMEGAIVPNVAIEPRR